MDKLQHTKTILTSAFLALIFSVTTRADVVDSLLTSRNEVYIKFARLEQLSLSQLSQMMSIVRVKNDTVEAFLNRHQWEKFKQLKIAYHVILPEKKISSLRLVSQGYPTQKEYEQMMYAFQSQYSEVCRIYVAGISVKNRPLLFARINTDTLLNKPSVMLTSSMHGNETGGMMLMLKLIDYLLSRRGIDAQITYLTDSLDIWINPLANPDGFYFDTTDIYQATRFNANGVDLNRNFPDPVMGAHPDGMNYQPETQAMMNLLRRYRFTMSANFHSGEEVVNYPWDSQPELHPDDAWFRTLAKTYADSAIQYGTNGYFQTYIGGSNIAGITNGYAWYPVYGGRQDYVTYFLQGREVTIEIDNDFITPEAELEQLWQSNYHSLLSWLSFALQGIKGQVSDKFTRKPIAAEIGIVNYDQKSSMVKSDSSHGIFYRLLLPGKYSLQISSSGYETCLIDSFEVQADRYAYLNVQLSPATNIASKNDNSPSMIYPNPVHNRLFLVPEMSSQNPQCIIMNSDGRIIARYVWQSSGIDVSGLTPGIYYLVVEYKAKKYRYKFLKLP